MLRFSTASRIATASLTTVVAVTTTARAFGAFWIHNVLVRAISKSRVTKRYVLMIVEGFNVRTCSMCDSKHNPSASANTSEAAAKAAGSVTSELTANNTSTAI